MGSCTGQEVEWDQGFLRPRSILIFLCCSKVSKTQVAVVLPFTSHFASFFAVTPSISKLFTHSLIFVHKLRAKEKAIQ